MKRKIMQSLFRLSCVDPRLTIIVDATYALAVQALATNIRRVARLLWAVHLSFQDGFDKVWLLLCCVMWLGLLNETRRKWQILVQWDSRLPAHLFQNSL